jgi:chromosome segregation ATPase
MKSSTIVVVLGLSTLALGSGRMSASQGAARASSSPQEEVLPALLTEVRGLRAAMEQMASAGPRVQLALGRVQLQEQRVNNLARRLEDSRTRLVESQRAYDGMQQQLRDLDAAIREPARPDGPRVADLQGAPRETERQLAVKAADVQRMTAETAAIEADLATEQGRWIDLNQRMEALEQSLVRR